MDKLKLHMFIMYSVTFWNMYTWWNISVELTNMNVTSHTYFLYWERLKISQRSSEVQCIVINYSYHDVQ